MGLQVSSFTSNVKEELTTKPYSHERLLAIFAAFAKANGRVVRNQQGFQLFLKTDYAKIAKLMFDVLRKEFNIPIKFAYTHTERFKRKIMYQVVVESRVDEILNRLHLNFTDEIDNYLIELKSNEAIAGYLTGLFLATGSVNHPQSSNYHLEMSSTDHAYLKSVLRLIKRLKGVSFDFKITERRLEYILYLKRSDQIANFLILLGATDATLEYENIRVARDYAMNDHRWQICENANMKKTIASSDAQVQDIKFLKKMVGLDSLPNIKMQLLASLRLKNDGLSMIELANRLSKKLKQPVSKSNINHLFRSIKKLATQVRGQQR
jgi:DNA-binding protein WhiA